MDTNIKLGSFGKMEVFSQNSQRKFKYIKIVGACCAGTNLEDLSLIEHPTATPRWSSGLLFVSKVDRWVVATPQLTSSGMLSKTCNIILMAPNANTFQKHWEQLTLDEWITGISTLVSDKDSVPAIATKEFWMF